MTGTDFLVSQEDLQHLSAMLDGELSDLELDVLLKRMAVEPDLGRAFTRLSQLQAAVHHQSQSMLNIDLSQKIAAKLASAEVEMIPTPIIPFPDKVSRHETQRQNDTDISNTVINDKPAVAQQAAVSYQAAEDAAGVAVNEAVHSGFGYRFAKVKGFRRQLFAHLAVAASVASVTIWVQNQYMESAPQMVQTEVQEERVNPAAGSIPAALIDDQVLPLETVGNRNSSDDEEAANQVRVEPLGRSEDSANSPSILREVRSQAQ